MLSNHLTRFNNALEEFQRKFPREIWSSEFKKRLIHDFTFYSARIEDEKLNYGDTIKFLNDQLVRKGKMKSLLEVANHKDVLASVIDRYDTFELTEETIKAIHKDLMSDASCWETDFKPHLVGAYRNIPAVGYREPYFKNKDYIPLQNIEMAIASHLNSLRYKLENVDNSADKTHLISAIAYFHNIFLNKIHPFADGNGRVCRIIMGTFLMKNQCPPIFVQITSDEDRFKYISTIVECENQDNDRPLIEFLANGMAQYMEKKVKNFDEPV